MVTIVIDRPSVHAGDDTQGHGHRWVERDGFRLGEVVLASVERIHPYPFMGGGTWLIQAVHGGVVEDVPGWGLDVRGAGGEHEDLAVVEGYRSVQREVRQPDGTLRTQIVPVGVESYTVRPMMSEHDLRRRVIDAVRPGPGGEHVFFASRKVEHPRPWRDFRARMTLSGAGEAAEAAAFHELMRPAMEEAARRSAQRPARWLVDEAVTSVPAPHGRGGSRIDVVFDRVGIAAGDDLWGHGERWSLPATTTLADVVRPDPGGEHVFFAVPHR